MDEHSEKLDAAAAEKAEVRAKAESAVAAVKKERDGVANFIPPYRPPRERLAQLSKARQSQVRQANMMYLYNIFTEREWDIRDIIDALDGVDVLSDIFHSKQ
eukprot:5607099-Pleurochrysis_carterae.AAC.1